MTAEPRSERELVAIAALLGAARVGTLTPRERRLLAGVKAPMSALVPTFRDRIERGADPLGAAFCGLRGPVERRALGATYTPEPLVDAMMRAAAIHEPLRVVDPGAGSGRFVVAAGRRFPKATLVAVERDPVAALLCRAHLSAAGLAARSEVICGDFRELELRPVRGRTLFVGNPPYVRHHSIEPRWKRWLFESARALGHSASRLAGLHVHFALATAVLGKKGDYGVFVTAAEWLDVNYGSLMRALFSGRLGARSLHAIDPRARVFADADTTAVVTCFEIGATEPSVRFCFVRSAGELGSLDAGRPVSRERLLSAPRWTPLFRRASRKPSGFVELGELCRVHRGQVTGKNRVWIAGGHSSMLPESVLFRTVTRARELFLAGESLGPRAELRSVIDLPEELDGLAPGERRAVERFLAVARTLGANRGFIAEHRRAWWSVGLREPAPILATYMARRPPAFVRNLARARHINVAHGLYPREALSPESLDELARYLSVSTRLGDGRTYSGGLTKFEPREMERLLVPDPSLLRARRGKMG